MTADGAGKVRETVAAVLAEHPVSVAFLFGSRARGDAHTHSDIDIAVTFDELEPGDPGYTDALLGVSADLSAALDTDNVDVVDLRRAQPSLLRAIVEDGVRVVGTAGDARRLLEQIDPDDDPAASPAERFDDVLAAIDDHLA